MLVKYDLSAVTEVYISCINVTYSGSILVRSKKFNVRKAKKKTKKLQYYFHISPSVFESYLKIFYSEDKSLNVKNMM